MPADPTKTEEWKDAAPPSKNPWSRQRESYVPAISSSLARQPQAVKQGEVQGSSPQSKESSTPTERETTTRVADSTPQQSRKEGMTTELPVLSSNKEEVVWKDAAPPSKSAWMNPKAWGKQKEIQVPIREDPTPSVKVPKVGRLVKASSAKLRREEAGKATVPASKDAAEVEKGDTSAKQGLHPRDVVQNENPQPQEADDTDPDPATAPSTNLEDSSRLQTTTEVAIQPHPTPSPPPTVIVSSQWVTRPASSTDHPPSRSDVQEQIIASLTRQLSQSLERFRELASQELLLHVETAQKELREVAVRNMCGEDVVKNLVSLTSDFSVALEILGRLRKMNKRKSKEIAGNYAWAQGDIVAAHEAHAAEVKPLSRAEHGPGVEEAHCPESSTTVPASPVTPTDMPAAEVRRMMPSNRQIARLHKDLQRTSERTAVEMWRVREYADIQVYIKSPQWYEPPIPSFGLHRHIVEPECGWLKKAIAEAAAQSQDAASGGNANASPTDKNGGHAAHIRLDLRMNPILAALCFGFAYTGKLVHDPDWEFQNLPNFRGVCSPNPANPYDISSLAWSLNIYNAALQLQMPRLCCHIVAQVEELALNITEQTLLARRWGLGWHWAYIVEEFEHAMVHYLYNGNNLCGWEPLRVAVMALQDAISMRVGSVRNTVREMYWWVSWHGSDNRRAHQDWVDYKKKYGCVTALKKGELVPSREEMARLIELRGDGKPFFDKYGLPIHHLATDQ